MSDLSDKIKRNLNWTGVKKILCLVAQPLCQGVKRVCIKKRARDLQSHYEDVVHRIKQSGRTKLRFAAYVIFDSTYGMDGAFKLMLKNKEHWDPYVVVIPDISRGKEHAIRTYKKAQDFF